MIITPDKLKTALTIKENLDKLNTYEELLNYTKQNPKLKYYIKRICFELLIGFEENDEFSLESFKSLIWFILVSQDFVIQPSITISESGIIYVEWKLNKNNSLSIRFQKDYFADYVIFKSSLHPTKTRMHLYGSAYVLDMIDLIHDLNLTYLFWLSLVSMED